MSFTIKPNRGRVFVELLPVAERKTSAGLWLPDKHAEQSRIGTVLAVADDVKGFKPGDKVFINFFSGTGVDYPDSGYQYDTHRFLSEVEILGFIE
jgi:co-chaperonin GroES (HSP10)